MWSNRCAAAAAAAALNRSAFRNPCCLSCYRFRALLEHAAIKNAVHHVIHPGCPKDLLRILKTPMQFVVPLSGGLGVQMVKQRVSNTAGVFKVAPVRKGTLHVRQTHRAVSCRAQTGTGVGNGLTFPKMQLPPNEMGGIFFDFGLATVQCWVEFRDRGPQITFPNGHRCAFHTGVGVAGKVPRRGGVKVQGVTGTDQHSSFLVGHQQRVLGPLAQQRTHVQHGTFGLGHHCVGDGGGGFCGGGGFLAFLFSTSLFLEHHVRIMKCPNASFD